MATYVSQYSTTGFCMLTFILTFPVWKPKVVSNKAIVIKKMECFLSNRPSTGIKRVDGSFVHHLHSHPCPSTVSSTAVPHMSTAKHFHVWRGISIICSKSQHVWGRWKFFHYTVFLLTGVEVVYITNSLSRNKRFNLCSIAYILLQVIPLFCI